MVKSVVKQDSVGTRGQHDDSSVVNGVGSFDRYTNRRRCRNDLNCNGVALACELDDDDPDAAVEVFEDEEVEESDSEDDS